MSKKRDHRQIKRSGILYEGRLYYHPSMKQHRGKNVKVIPQQGDPSSLSVELPTGQSCQASLMASRLMPDIYLSALVPETDKLAPEELDLASASQSRDGRRAEISEGAIEWLKSNWRKYRGPRYLYRGLLKAAEGKDWRLPTESWLYKKWRQQKEVAIGMQVPSQKQYVAQFNQFLPKDFTEISGVLMLSGEDRGPGLVLLMNQATLEQLWRSGLEEILMSRLARPVWKQAGKAEQPDQVSKQ